jgi:hypothetical protein
MMVLFFIERGGKLNILIKTLLCHEKLGFWSFISMRKGNEESSLKVFLEAFWVRWGKHL